MPIAPTNRMRVLAKRWLTDSVTISTVVFASDTRPIGKATTTETDARQVSALVRQQSVELADSQTVRRDLRQLVVWVDGDCVAPVAGQRLTVDACNDASLVGVFGEIIDVDRDSIRAIRRLTVRMANNA